MLLRRCLVSMALPKAVLSSALQLILTASGVSPLAHEARLKSWAAIRAGLEGLGVGADSIAMCRLYVIDFAGENGCMGEGGASPSARQPRGCDTLRLEGAQGHNSQ